MESIPSVERLAQALDVAPEWLAFGHKCDARGSATGIGQRLRQARESAGFTMERLAEMLGYRHRSAVAHLESETNEMDLSLCEHAAKVLQVAPEWLAFGHECPPLREHEDRRARP